MKIEQLLVQHFYLNKEVTLQGMGTFRLSPDIILPIENDKDVVLPENAISFLYNPKAPEDDSLINYIVQQTRKIKPLASADLDSYLVLGKQFLNIGKPFKIEGMGILEKNQQGDFEFRQANLLNTKTEAAPVALKEKAEDEDISFAATRNRPGNGKKYLLLAVSVILLGLVGWAAWYFLHRKNENNRTEVKNTLEQPVTPVTTVPADTVKTPPQKTDSVAIPPPQQSPVVKNEGNYNFKVVFKETNNKGAALIKMKDMIARGHHVILYTNDSVYYKLAEPFRLPLSDTARIRDSLNKYYYQGKAYIEMN